MILETDSLCAYQMLNNKSYIANRHSNIVQAIQGLLKNHWEAKISHIVREANYAADWLAEYAMGFDLGCHRLIHPPPQFAQWLNHDRIGVSYNRLLPL